MCPSCDSTVPASLLWSARMSEGRLTSCQGWMIQQVFPGVAVWVGVNQLVLVSVTAEPPFSEARLQQHRVVDRAGGREEGRVAQTPLIRLSPPLQCLKVETGWRQGGQGGQQCWSVTKSLLFPPYKFIIHILVFIFTSSGSVILSQYARLPEQSLSCHHLSHVLYKPVYACSNPPDYWLSLSILGITSLKWAREGSFRIDSVSRLIGPTMRKKVAITLSTFCSLHSVLVCFWVFRCITMKEN